MAKRLIPLVRDGGFLASKKFTPLVRYGGYTTQNPQPQDSYRNEEDENQTEEVTEETSKP